MIHESKDSLAGNGCVDSRTQAAQHMGLHQTALDVYKRQDQDGTQHQLQRLLRCAVQVDHGVKVAVPH